MLARRPQRRTSGRATSRRPRAHVRARACARGRASAGVRRHKLAGRRTGKRWRFLLTPQARAGAQAQRRCRQEAARAAGSAAGRQRRQPANTGRAADAGPDARPDTDRRPCPPGPTQSKPRTAADGARTARASAHPGGPRTDADGRGLAGRPLPDAGPGDLSDDVIRRARAALPGHLRLAQHTRRTERG